MLRALAIVLVVGTHADAFTLQGGAHLLLVVVGYNLARFQLADVPGRSRARPLLRGALAVALPVALWVGGVAALTGYYRPTTALLLTNLVSSGEVWTVQWQFWFLEVVVWASLGLAALLAVPALDRLERRRPYGTALAVLMLALLLRLALAGVHAGPMERYSAPVLLWAVALGWLVARSRTPRARAGASLLATVSVVGFLGEPRPRGRRGGGRPAAGLAALAAGPAGARAAGRRAGRGVDVRLPVPLAGVPAVRADRAVGRPRALARRGRRGVEGVDRLGAGLVRRLTTAPSAHPAREAARTEDRAYVAG